MSQRERQDSSEMIPLFKIMWDGAEIEAVSASIRRGFQWAEGPNIELFESLLIDYLGVEGVLVCNSGTSALHLAMVACGIKHHHEVIVPSFTFIATANAVKFVGANPVFADIEPETYGLDPIDVERKITPFLTTKYVSCSSGFSCSQNSLSCTRSIACAPTISCLQVGNNSLANVPIVLQNIFGTNISPPSMRSREAITKLAASSSVMKYRVISGSVMVIVPCWDCSCQRGITEPRLPQKFPHRTTENLVRGIDHELASIHSRSIISFHAP